MQLYSVAAAHGLVVGTGVVADALDPQAGMNQVAPIVLLSCGLLLSVGCC